MLSSYKIDVKYFKTRSLGFGVFPASLSASADRHPNPSQDKIIFFPYNKISRFNELKGEVYIS